MTTWRDRRGAGYHERKVGPARAYVPGEPPPLPPYTPEVVVACFMAGLVVGFVVGVVAWL